MEKNMELEEAIKELQEKIESINKHLINYEKSECFTANYIHLKQEKKALETVLNHLTKQEKMIELMLEYLNFYGVEDDICTAELSKDCNENCKQCIKQYFEKKAEENE